MQGMRVSRIRGVTLDLSRKEIGDKGAAEAVAVMLLWNAPSMTKLDLRYVPVDPSLFNCCSFRRELSVFIFSSQFEE